MPFFFFDALIALVKAREVNLKHDEYLELSAYLLASGAASNESILHGVGKK